MRVISRKEFLKAGAALPLALNSLGLRAAAKKAKLGDSAIPLLQTLPFQPALAGQPNCAKWQKN